MNNNWIFNGHITTPGQRAASRSASRYFTVWVYDHHHHIIIIIISSSSSRPRQGGVVLGGAVLCGGGKGCCAAAKGGGVTRGQLAAGWAQLGALARWGGGEDFNTAQYSNGNLLPIINLSKLSWWFHEQYVNILALTIALPIADFLSLHFT